MQSAAPHYTERLVFGPFKRLATTGTQTPQDMRAIIRSGELWGNPPAFGIHPVAQAHRGVLRQDELGFEFYADAAPDQKWGPPRWQERTDGTVWVEGGKAKVKIYVSRVTMPFEEHAQSDL